MTVSQTVILGVPGPNPDVTSGLTPVTGALLNKRLPWTLPNAILVSAKEIKSYADILRKAKADIPKEDIEDSIEKVRKTVT